VAQKVNITIDQGTTFSYPFTLLDTNGDVRDLTTYTANAQLRKAYTSTNATSFTCVTSNTDPNLVISLTANQSANVVGGRYVYDIQLRSNTDIVTRYVEGIVTVTPRVTR
jgi:hypothetical protein